MFALTCHLCLHTTNELASSCSFLFYLNFYFFLLLIVLFHFATSSYFKCGGTTGILFFCFTSRKSIGFFLISEMVTKCLINQDRQYSHSVQRALTNLHIRSNKIILTSKHSLQCSTYFFVILPLNINNFNSCQLKN